MRTSPSWLLALALLACARAPAGVLGVTTVEVELGAKHQLLDGFGTTAPALELDWVSELYFTDLGASIVRMDLTPAFASPYADRAYNSPWFHNTPPLPGPDGNNVRTYSSASDYTREWAGARAQIAVMGPDLERNLARLDLTQPRFESAGKLAKRGARDPSFKLIGSVWSPAPWLKLPSGARIEGHDGIMPKTGTPWPFIWGGNFAGGVLDTSGAPRPEFDDAQLGGTGPTSALTQFSRTLAALLAGFQRRHGVRFHAISIQNELNFETFYNSCSYPRAEGYVAALKAVRSELDRHAELRSILIMGPEDLLGETPYALWQFGAEDQTVHKNLQLLRAIGKDEAARRALGFFAVHGYAPDGVKSAGSQPDLWRMWAEGWRSAPGAGLPEQVQGFRAYQKKSWMTETSGEQSVWAPSAATPLEDSALGLALKIHQALTTGGQSAWLYWQISDGEPISKNTLTDGKLRERAPKYVAAKHFFRWLRPGSRRVTVRLPAGVPLVASAYVHQAANTITVVLINPGGREERVRVQGLVGAGGATVRAFTSTQALPWQESEQRLSEGDLTFAVPARSVVTLVSSPLAGR